MSEDFLSNFNEKIKKMYVSYNEAVNNGNYDEALKIGKEIMDSLLKVAKEYILSNLNCPNIRRLVEDIVNYHEKNLGYIEGTEETLTNMPILYTYDAMERALRTLALSIQELFSFVLGALVVLADILKYTEYRNDRGESKFLGAV